MPGGKTGRQAEQFFQYPSEQDGMFRKSHGELAESERDLPVECLGLTFENEEARRAHFLGELQSRLEELQDRLANVPFSDIDDAVARLAAVENWPMGDEACLRRLAEHMARAEHSKDLLQRWKDEVGFPDGTIHDILKLSDPPWHTACPNPFLGAFTAAYGNPYDSAASYRRKPFAVDVSEGKTHPVYRAHGYHTKVPHLAIVPSILHYTEPGDLVLDGFAGSGMTGVAAQYCGTAPEKWRKELEARWVAEGLGKPCWGARRAILCDLSPAAGFIAANYTLPFDVDAFAEAGHALFEMVEEELGWMYETLHADDRTKGRIDYTVWSEVFTCPECANEIVFFEVALDQASGRVRNSFACPTCDASLTKDKLERLFQYDMDAASGQLWKHATFRPVLIQYKLNGQTFVKPPDDKDHDIIRRIEDMPLPREIPTDRLPIEVMNHGSRLAPKGITHVHHFFFSRAAHALALMWRRANAHPDSRIRHMLVYLVEQGVYTFSLLNRYRPNKGSQTNQVLSGVYYVPSQIAEGSVRYRFENKFDKFIDAFRNSLQGNGYSCMMSANTSTRLGLPDASIDYIFTDPPFGENIFYADLNLLVESWHGVMTNTAQEAIMDRFKGKGLREYQRLMQRCFEEYNRVLKPGRWITVVFHNSRNAVWTAIQEAMLAARFVVADVRTMDKQQGSYRQVTSTAVKQDLVISAYKPNEGLEERFALEPGSEEGAWDFVRIHLSQLPVFVGRDGCAEIVAERQPHLLFDRMVAFHVQRNVAVPLSVGDFLAEIAKRLPERDGMAFLPDQVAEYDKKRAAIEVMTPPEIFVVDESSSIQWLKRHLGRRPQRFQEIHPQFLREIAGWRKHEKLPELFEMLEQNFLRYTGVDEVPSQIHSYLSTNFKDLRNLAKDHPALRAKAKDRWYVPDPSKAADVEKQRARILLREFKEYCKSSRSRLKLFRLEAIRAGFFKAYQDQDYGTILNVAKKLPETVLQEDPKLMLWYDQALTRTGEDA